MSQASTNITEAYKCQDCNYQYFRKSDMERHINLNKYHITVKVYKCNFCGDEFKGKRNLKQHLDGMHSGVIYKCSSCGEEYKWMNYFKQHMEKHEGHDYEIGLPTMAYTPGTGKTEGLHISCTSENFIALEKLVSDKMKEFNRKIELGQKLKVFVNKNGYNENGLDNDMKEA